TPAYMAAHQRLGYSRTMQEDFSRLEAEAQIGTNGSAIEHYRIFWPDEMILRAIIPPGRATWGDGKWESPLAYSIVNKSTGMKYIFRYRGTGWKLCGFDASTSTQ